VGKGRRLRGYEPETVEQQSSALALSYKVQIAARNTLFIALSSKNMNERYICKIEFNTCDVTDPIL
jgi:hypothetical protein